MTGPLGQLEVKIDFALRDYDALPTEHRDNDVRDEDRSLHFTVRDLLRLRAALAKLPPPPDDRPVAPWPVCPGPA